VKAKNPLQDRTPLVTVVIPARNEAADIEQCLEAVADQDYPGDKVEVLVVDGASTDRTAAAANAAFTRLGIRGRVITNPAGTTPSNLNAGLAQAAGDVLCRVDARSVIPSGYVSRVVDILAALPEVAVVGGAQVALARSDGAVAQGVARALNNHWGMGFSRYRRGAASGPSDTVYLGAFRTAQLRASGGWDERLSTNQDFDLNRRMSRMGTVWFDAELNVGYLPRPNLRELYRQYRRFGQWKVRYWRMTKDRPQRRQVAIVVGAPTAALTGLLVVVFGGRRSRLAVIALATAAAALTDILGSRAPAPLRHRVAAVVTLACTSTGWLSGILAELFRQERPVPGAADLPAQRVA
jgi:glycosyltransferase involved in cell wall biosynthesis